MWQRFQERETGLSEIAAAAKKIEEHSNDDKTKSLALEIERRAGELKE